MSKPTLLHHREIGPAVHLCDATQAIRDTLANPELHALCLDVPAERETLMNHLRSALCRKAIRVRLGADNRLETELISVRLQADYRQITPQERRLTWRNDPKPIGRPIGRGKPEWPRLLRPGKPSARLSMTQILSS